jgi:hypothetical protein
MAVTKPLYRTETLEQIIKNSSKFQTTKITHELEYKFKVKACGRSQTVCDK